MIDIKIAAVLSRKHLAKQVAEQSGGKIIFDDRGVNGGGDAWYNAKRVLRSCESSHILYLQDDIVLCDNFLQYAEKCMQFMPEAIWSFFVGVIAEPSVIKTDNSATPFVRVKGCKTSGQALIFPKQHIEPLITETEFIFGNETRYKRMDSRIGMWCAYNSIPLMTTNPQLVQHLGVKSTIANHNRNGNNYVRSFKDNINSLSLNFDADFYVETSKLISPHLWTEIPKGVEYYKQGIKREKERSKNESTNKKTD